MRRQILTTLSVLALTSSLFVGVAGASAGGGVPLPPRQPAELFIPPNCEWLEGRGGAYLDCDLPPECELVPFDDGISIGWEVECDVDPGCYLATGEWDGVMYFYIDCWESECIGGCEPTVPVGIGLKARN